MRLKNIWKSTLTIIELKLDSPADFKTWFKNTDLVSLEKKVATVGCANSFTADWLEKNFFEVIKNSLENATGEDIITVKFSISTSSKTSKLKNDALSGPLFEHMENLQNKEKQIEDKILRSGLNSKYNFNNFIVGSSNRLAHAAALAIVDNPGSIYNPFYIYGGVGLGKTHLMQAIGIEILKKKPSATIHYCSCESFLNELVNAIRSGKTNEFRSKYRELDVLILDDIQFISNKVETQNELFHTFNVLHQANKQIILASDRPPTEIQNLEDRLRSRFQGGMVADINQPDYEMKIAILQKKCEEKGFSIPETAIEYIARIVNSNIRELEGALIKVIAFAGINKGNLTEKEIAKILGKDTLSKRKKVKPREIISAVCENFEVNIREIRGKRRTAQIATARQVAMYLLRSELDIPLTKVARALNRSDHTTVIHAISKIEGLLEAEEEIRSKISTIKSKLAL